MSFVHVIGNEVRIGRVAAFGSEYTDGTVNVEGSNCHIETLVLIGGGLGLKADAIQNLHVGSIHSVGLDKLMDLGEFGGVEGAVFSSIQDVGSGGPDHCIEVAQGVNVEFVAATLDTPWADTGVSAIYVTNSERVTFGPNFSADNAFHTVVEFEDSADCRFMGTITDFGSSTNTVDGIALSGATHGTFITGATFRPGSAGGANPNLAINDQTSGMDNYAAGNDFGELALYDSSPAVAGPIILDWPADPTYGDNFTS